MGNGVWEGTVLKTRNRAEEAPRGVGRKEKGKGEMDGGSDEFSRAGSRAYRRPEIQNRGGEAVIYF